MVGDRSLPNAQAALTRNTDEGSLLRLISDDAPVVSFDPAADDYDAARPSYPPGVFDALGELDGLRVLDVGAGTGIATRLLLDRGAPVVAIDPGREMLRRALEHSPSLPAVSADGAALPIRSGSVDLVCFAQSWHWLDPRTRVTEAQRVLRPGGRWAAWWSHARADDQDWFDRYWTIIERWCHPTHRNQRDTDWGATIPTGAALVIGPRIVVPWLRELPVDDWMTDQASHSYIVDLAPQTRARVLNELRRTIDRAFPAGTMSVRYETWLWTATRT